MTRQHCTFIADEQAHQLAYLAHHHADRVGHRGRAFQLRPEHRLEGLLPGVRDTAGRLFPALGIQWHPCIGHGRSSQAACVNFLLPLADWPDLLAEWVGGVLGRAPPAMLPVEQAAAGDHRFVAFEYTGPDARDWLGEADGGVPRRGAHATASDATVAFAGAAGRELLLIEWKYTEEYRYHRLSDDRRGKRVVRYGGRAFHPDGPIRADLGLALADFRYEPFYQLLRQQMLSRQIERAGVFGRVRVLHLSPAGNRALHAVTAPALRTIGDETYADAFAAYCATLADPTTFVERSIEESFAALAADSRAPWMAALAERYPSLLPAMHRSAMAAHQAALTSDRLVPGPPLPGASRHRQPGRLRQKGVDMRIGLDIAALALKRFIGTIVPVSGDGDFVPAAKLARREGMQFILDPLWQPRRLDGLHEHIDGLQLGLPNPSAAERDPRRHVPEQEDD